MQVSAILAPVVPGLTDQTTEVPVEQGEWAALMADFPMEPLADMTPETVKEEGDSQLPDVQLTDLAVLLPPIEEQLLPAIPTVEAEEPFPFPAEAAPILLTEESDIPTIMPDAVETGALPLPNFTAPVEPAMTTEPPVELPKPAPRPIEVTPDIPVATQQSYALQKPEVVVAEIPLPGARPSTPLRSRVENLWEMQGFIPILTDKPTEVVPAPPAAPNASTLALTSDPEPTEAPELPEMVLPETDLELSAALPDPEADSEFVLARSVQLGPIPLLHHSSTPTQATSQPLSPSFIAAVQSQIAEPVPGGISVTLAPVELGELHLMMVQDGDTMRVSITAERPETLDLLRRNTDQLTQELRQAGFQSASFSFAQGGQGGAGQALPKPEPIPNENPTFTPTPARLADDGPAPLPAGRGLDLRI